MQSSTRLFRSRQAALRALLEEGLRRAWPLLDLQRVDATFPVWVRQVAPIVSGQRAISAMLAARYLQDLGVAVTLAPTVPADVLVSSLNITGPVSIKQAMIAGRSLELAASNAFTASTAAAVRHVLEGGNETVRVSGIADPNVSGWRRVVSAGACGYCREREGVYMTTADFNCHDGCNCSVEPVV